MKEFKLVYSNEFVDGLTQILEHIKKDSLEAARLFERNVRKKIKLLKQFPEMGRIANDARLDGIRILVIGNYLLLYEIIKKERRIYLHAFCHGARDYPNLFKDLKQ